LKIVAGKYETDLLFCLFEAINHITYLFGYSPEFWRSQPCRIKHCINFFANIHDHDLCWKNTYI